jgi:hypothetical protein
MVNGRLPNEGGSKARRTREGRDLSGGSARPERAWLLTLWKPRTLRHHFFNDENRSNFRKSR